MIEKEIEDLGFSEGVRNSKNPRKIVAHMLFLLEDYKEFLAEIHQLICQLEKDIEEEIYYMKGLMNGLEYMENMERTEEEEKSR